jgi:raffinose/stachyose/melibiose transport system substrate-binding protein
MVVTACGGAVGPATPKTASQAPAASTSAAPTTAEKVTLNLLVGIPEDPAIEQQARAQVKEFNDSHPNITVVRESLNNDQLRTLIQTRLSSGSIDVFGYDTGPGFGGVLAKAGLLADMGPAYGKYNWPIFDWAKSRCTYRGVLSCVPGQVEELGIFYNKTLFDQNGFQAPKTLDELKTIMDAFKAKRITPLAFGDKDQWPAGHQFSMTLSNIVGREGLDARLYGEKPWNDAETVKAIDLFFKQFNGAGYFPKSVNAVTYDDANAQFYAGKAAMVPTGTWLVSDITVKAKFDVGFFPFPSIDGSSVSPPAGLGGGTFVNKNSKHLDAAFEYMNWLLQPAQIKKWDLETFASIPALPIDTAGLKVSPLFGKVLGDLAQSSGTAGTFGYNIDVLTPSGFNDQMSTGFQEVLAGKLTPQQHADKLQAAYKKAMAAGDTVQKP